MKIWVDDILAWFRRPRGKYVLMVSSSEATGPSGAGSRAEGNARNPRLDSGIKLTVPRRLK